MAHTPANTPDFSDEALLLIGFQRDYFSREGRLRPCITDPAVPINAALENTVALIRGLMDTNITIISTPIRFSPNYEELGDPEGILKEIKDRGAFLEGAEGAETVPEITVFGDRILEVTGKSNMDAFMGTRLQQALIEKSIRKIYLCGCILSACINATAMHAYNLSYRVTVLSDCTVGRTMFEQNHFLKDIVPLYGKVQSSKELLRRAQTPAP